MTYDRTVTEEMKEFNSEFSYWVGELRSFTWQYILWGQNRQANVDEWNNYLENEVLKNGNKISHEELPLFLKNRAVFKENKRLFAEHRKYHEKNIKYAIEKLVELLEEQGMTHIGKLPIISVPDKFNHGSTVTINFMSRSEVSITFTKGGTEYQRVVGG